MVTKIFSLSTLTNKIKRIVEIVLDMPKIMSYHCIHQLTNHITNSMLLSSGRSEMHLTADSYVNGKAACQYLSSPTKAHPLLPSDSTYEKLS